MKFDLIFVIAFVSAFTRVTAMLMVAPISAHAVPIQVRVLFGAVVASALTPLVYPMIGSVPNHIIDLAAIIIRDAFFGLLIGSCTQLAVSAFQAAGSLIDFQIGISSAQALNPMLGTAASPVAQLKTMLATVILLMVDGHHLMFQALASTYSLPAGGFEFGMPFVESIVSMVGRLLIISVQIAAPVSAVAVIIDIAAGVINKAVPQTQPFLIALPAKLGFGMVAVAVGLPILVAGVQKSLGVTFDALHHALGTR